MIDKVFRVEDSLVIDLGTVDNAMADQYGIEAGTTLITYDFVLVSEQESTDLRKKDWIRALQQSRRKVVILDGFPALQVYQFKP